jgi:hypothetical protein
MPLLTRIHGFLFKVETTEGVDATPTGANDAILTLGPPEISPAPEVFDPDLIMQSLDAHDPIVGRIPMQVRVQVPLKGAGGAADVPPEIGPLFRCSGFAETITPTTGPVKYEPASTQIKTGTAYVYRDGLLWKVLGCRGDLSVTWTAGGICVAEFRLTGLLGSKADAALPSFTYDATKPPVWKGGVMTIGGAAAAVQQLTLAMNNQISYPDNPNAAEGYDPPVITGRNVQGSINPLETLVATRNIFQDFRDGTKRAIVARVGSVAQNKVTLNILAAQYRGEQQADAAGKLIVNVPFSATGKDANVLNFTYD